MKKAKTENASDAVKSFLVNTLESASALTVKALTIIKSASTVIMSMVYRK